MEGNSAAQMVMRYVFHETSTSCIVTPNANFIPTSPALLQDVQMRSDGRYGSSDYTARPQIYFADYAHLPYIPTAEHPAYSGYHLLWRRPSATDLDPFVSGEGRAGSTLSPAIRATLTESLKGLANDVDEGIQSIRPLIDPKVLEHCFYLINHVRARLTLLNQKMPWYELCRLWGQFQRYWLELAGMQQYLRRTVDPMALYQDASPLPVDCFVGAFTDDRIVAKSLSTAGVPVWLIIPSESVDGDVPIIRAHVYPSPPPLIAPSLGNGLSPRSAWNSLGLIARGDPKSIVLRRQSDDQFMPNSSALEIQNAPTSSRAELGSIERGLHLSKMGGRQETPPRPTKRHQPYGPNPTHVIRVRPIQAESPQQLQPPLRFQRPVVLPEWSAALLEIEHLETARKAHRFWMPIGTFFNEDNPMRRERALINWLAVRESWFGHLAQSGLEGEPQLDREDWRHFLSHIPERGAFQRRRKNLAIFDQLLPQGAPVISPDESTLPYQWFNRLYDRETDNVGAG
ncbi:hypothetical protein SISSUDRAFT_1067267 [Sistotremastrum suecicum HHB10207 ss-3]|uniref:Uncharacterized protein n=1 Tax=Sistotremastrum suecicum HHB10207 ss-3 TaxID=1314776 RepID=A0A165XB19_9AGAM|nr:hypothetical protein SISSUDRAFT_1067267 [Sistotremastrum suecicum HHB10207 ss-3]